MRAARLLVLRGGAIGDFIVTLPALQALRNRWPDAHIELLGYPHVARLAELAGLVSVVRSLDDGRLARYFAPDARIRDEDQAYFKSFDVIVNYLHDPDRALHGNLKRCGAEVIIHGSPMVADRHAIDHFLAPLASLAIFDPSPMPRLHLPPPAHPPDLPECWAAIHPGSGGRAKIWPLDHFLHIADHVRRSHGLEPVFITADAEMEYIPDLDRRLAPYRRLHNLPLVELAPLLARATLYLGNDSGISHLAAALGIPTAAVFGPTNPRHWGPRGDRVELVSAPEGDLEALPPDAVLTALSRLI